MFEIRSRKHKNTYNDSETLELSRIYQDLYSVKKVASTLQEFDRNKSDMSKIFKVDRVKMKMHKTTWKNSNLAEFIRTSPKLKK